jgi:hypothetical protein
LDEGVEGEIRGRFFIFVLVGRGSKIVQTLGVIVAPLDSVKSMEAGTLG